MHDHSPLETVLDFVRGERPWPDLIALGCDIRFERGLVHIKGGLPAPVTPEARDFALGFAAEREKDQLAEWAAVVLGLIDIEFSAIEDGPLHHGVWDAAFREPLSAQTIEEITRLVGAQ